MVELYSGGLYGEGDGLYGLGEVMHVQGQGEGCMQQEDLDEMSHWMEDGCYAENGKKIKKTYRYKIENNSLCQLAYYVSVLQRPTDPLADSLTHWPTKCF